MRIYLKSSRGHPTRGGRPARGLGGLRRKNLSRYETFTFAWAWTDPLVPP
jgi:hypothetical protein